MSFNKQKLQTMIKQKRLQRTANNVYEQQKEKFIIQDGAIYISKFREAVKNRDMAIIKKFLQTYQIVKSGKRPEAREATYNIVHGVFLWAAILGFQDVIDLFIDTGIPVDAQERTKNTVLMIAAQNGNLKLVQHLLAKNANPNLFNNEGETALIKATKKGHMAVVKCLLSSKIPTNCNHQNNLGFTALGYAIKYGKEMVALLLGAKADPTLEDPKGGNALLYAMANDDVEMLKTLLNGDKSLLHKKNKNGQDLLEAIGDSSSINCPKCFQFVLQESEKTIEPKFLDVLIFNDKHDYIKLMETQLIKMVESKDINAQTLMDNNGNTLFIIAIEYQMQELLKVLISLETTIKDHPNRKGSMPFHMATLYENLELMEHLANSGFDINTAIYTGATALMCAVQYEKNESLQWLLKHKDINIHAKTKEGCTALALATQLNNVFATKCLLEKGADHTLLLPNNRCSLVMRAAAENQIEILKLLILHKSNIDLQEDEGITALMLAVSFGNKECVGLLAEAGADPCIENYYFDSALEMALQKGNVEILKPLLTPKVIKEVILNHEYQDKIGGLASNGDIVRCLREVGFIGEATSCQVRLLINFMDSITNSKKVDLKEIQGVISAIDVLKPWTIIQAYGFSTSLFDKPIFTFSNRCSKEIRFIVLERILSQTLSSINKDLTKVLEALQNSILDFQFSEQGSLCISMERNGRISEFTLSLQSIASLVAYVDSSILKSKLWECSEEYKELKEEEEIFGLKETILNHFSKMNLQIERHRILLTHLIFLANQHNRSNEMDALLNIQKLIDEQSKIFKDKFIILRTNGVMNCDDKQKIQSEIEAVQSLCHQYQIQVTDVLNNLNERILSAQSGIENTQQPKASSKNKRKKTKSHEKKERQEQAQMVPKDLSISEIASQPKQIVSSINRDLEIQKRELQAQKPQVKLKSVPAIPYSSTLDTEISKLIESSDLRKYTRVPKFTLERATKLAAHMRAQTGRSTLENVVNDSSVILPDPIHSEIARIVEVNSSLSALGQCLETRKGLEAWSENVRNVLFRAEDVIRKSFNEFEIILNVYKICEKIAKISESQLLLNKEGLVFAEIDYGDFLAVMNNITIPDFSLERAKAMIVQSEKELKLFREYIVKCNQENLQTNKKFVMALGYSFARLGTYVSDIQKNIHKNYPYLKDILIQYGHLIDFGKEFRHHDIAWEKVAQDFITVCIKESLAHSLQLLQDLQYPGCAVVDKACGSSGADKACGSSAADQGLLTLSLNADEKYAPTFVPRFTKNEGKTSASNTGLVALHSNKKVFQVF